MHTAAKESVWLTKHLKELGLPTDAPTTIHVDNQSAIKLAKNAEFHKRTKHIDVRYHYTRELIEKKMLELKYIPSEEQAADGLTKPLQKNKHMKMVSQLHMVTKPQDENNNHLTTRERSKPALQMSLFSIFLFLTISSATVTGESTWINPLLQAGFEKSPTTSAPYLATPTSATIISNPTHTNWGEWGRWEECAPGEHVIGFQLKVEPWRGNSNDDTALNGINFKCSRGNNIQSSVGEYGEWTKEKSCQNNSVAIGFDLRIEPWVKSQDDTAANNLKLICSDGDTLEGDGTTWGIWTGTQKCQSNQAMCGLQTQINNEGPDSTGLNNINVKCCPIPRRQKRSENLNQQLVLWRPSPTPITTGHQIAFIRVKMISPCIAMTSDTIHKDLTAESLLRCNEMYHQLFLNELEKFCPTERHPELILKQFKELSERKKRFISALVGILIMSMVTITAVAVAGVTQSAINSGKIADIQEEMERQGNNIRKLEDNSDMVALTVRNLQIDFDKLLQKLDAFSMDYQELKSKQVSSSYLISYVTTRLLTGKLILQEAAKIGRASCRERV